MYNYQDDEITELRKEIEQLKTGNRLHLELAEIKEVEIDRLREERDKLKEALRCLIALTATAPKEKE